MWRLAAWVISAAAFGAHVWHEHFRLRNSPRTTAWHASAAVALGAFGLAVAARIHAHVTGSGNPHLLTFALVAWPVLAGLPAFVVALAAAAGLASTRRPGQYKWRRERMRTHARRQNLLPGDPGQRRGRVGCVLREGVRLEEPPARRRPPRLR